MNIIRKIGSKAMRRMKASLGYYPIDVTLEFTTRCNALCKTCGRPQILGKLEIVDMPEMLFVNVINTLKEYVDLDTFIIAGLGEPTLHKNFDDYMYALREAFPTKNIELYTNGILLGKHLDTCIETTDSVFVGVNVAEPELYREHIGVDKFEQVKENIIALLQKRGKDPFGPSVKIQLLEMPINHNSWNRFYEMFEPYMSAADKRWHSGLVNFAGRVDITPYANPDAPCLKLGRRFPCWQLWMHLFFSANGDVWPCCIGTPLLKESGMLLGNLCYDSLEDILKNGVLDGIRSIHLHDDYSQIEPCRQCNVWRRHGVQFVKLFGKWR